MTPLLRRLHGIKPQVWLLLALALSAALLPLVAQAFTSDAAWITYILQPASIIAIGVAARRILGGQHDRLRHKGEKSLIVGSVIAVWFVAYFLTGMIVTYTHNAVAASWQAIVINLVIFGAMAVSMEYVRHAIMTLVGRRNGIWFGVIVSLVFALEQIGLVQLASLHGSIDIIKFCISAVLPALVSSFLLTYLAFTAGLGPQLTYRLGMLAVLYLPPIIPKYDWYFVGVAWLLLAVAVYVAIDRTRKDLAINGKHYHHARRAYDVMFLIATTMLALFMVGVFSYQPQVIMSDSMVPVFSRGAMVIVQKANAMDVEVGDIIQYKTPEKMITHRVTKVDLAEDGSGKRVFTTQGDNNPSPDPKVGPEQIVGIIRAEIPYIGYPTVWLREIVK